MAWIDRLSWALGLAAAWLFFAAGLILTYEVVARYVFDAPTIWAAEVAQLILIWGTFAAMAWLLRRGQHIRITILEPRMGALGRRSAEAFSLLFIAAVSIVAIWYGADIAWDSYVRGRSTGTMLNIPNWWSEATIPVAFAVLLGQCLVQLVRCIQGQEQETAEPSGPEGQGP